MILNSPFKPPWWLTSAHAQTIYPTLMSQSLGKLMIEEERVELPDGDFIDLAWAKESTLLKSPIVILLHGLGGGLQSAYTNYLINALSIHGFRAVLMQFRGAGATPNRLPRAYHSGDTQDFDFILRRLHTKEPSIPKMAIGISLGGNVLLKWLGEQGKTPLIQGAVAVSVPFELEKAVARINSGFSRIYQKHLLQRLQETYLKKLAHNPKEYPFSKKQLLETKTFYQFDQLVTAPLHGFKSATDYYQKSSSKYYLDGIRTPTLIIHAEDDPFMVPSVIPTHKELSNSIILELCQYGGHVGFVTTMPTEQTGRFWLAQRIPSFLRELL